ncbi:MAG TPA: GAF domain-containing sensor histidine kinase [Longimicrobiaceae bacterium]|nr:GAF domain-containing sensor histidine kinase [Longimicrobiaceae bacterium]
MSTLSTDAPPTGGQPTAADPAPTDAGTRFAFLSETSRILADSLDVETTLATGAGLALPHFGTWCMVDIVEADDTIRRVAVIHPDPEKQRLARDFYAAHPPGRDDPLGAPRVIRTSESEFVLAYDEVLEGIAEEEHRLLLQELGARSFLMVPMSARGQTLGAITFVSDDRRRYDEADLLLAEDLGRRCAMAVDNARLYAASQEALRAADEARKAATLTARRAEELLGEANVARHEAEDADLAKTTFLGTISHEFRTPLTAVQGFTDLLTAEVPGPLNEKQHHQVERIRAASDHLLELIEEILTFARRQAGRSELRLREVDLAGFVRDTAALAEPLAAEKGLRLLVSIPEGPIPCRTDPGKLRQIILNLAANAVKFTDEGEVRLDLEAADDSVLIRVGDTGLGIAPGHAERVFDAFWQVDHSAGRVGGTGLGLAVTRQLTGLLGGEVALESELGSGTVLTVRLPLVTPELEAPPADGAAEVSHSERRVRGRRGVPLQGSGPPLPDTPRGERSGEVPS